ncbi:MAG TPA: aldose 1-epimerase [Ruminiclostridium sp.]
MHFDYKQFERKGLEIVALYYVDEENDDKKEIYISPGHGMNLCKYRANDLRIIKFDPDKIRESFYGTPLLYPTPNRVYEGKFNYNGKEYPQIKNGEVITIHGLLYNEPFNGMEITKTEDSISVSAYVDFSEKNHLFEAFPFEHRLSVKYTLDKSGVRFDYEIENREMDQSIPFGIALHPYFSKIDGEDETLIKAPFEYVYKTTESLIPTGELLKVNRETDLSDYVSVGTLNLDTVFTGNTNNEPAVIKYSKTGLQVTLKSSNDFTNMVIYTPKGKNYFCLENQTCATNAHNLYDQGMEEISGLKFVDPNSKFGGFVQFVTEKI